MSKKKFGLMEDMGELQFKMAVEEKISSVINTYYLIVQAKQQLQVDQEAVSISEERLKIAENNLQIGAGSGLEVLQAKVDLNTDSSASIEQEVVLENTKIQLNQLLSRPVETRFDVQEEIELKPKLRLPEIQELTERQNKRIQLSQKQVRVDEMRFREIRAQRFPQIDVVMGYDLSRSESEAGFVASSQTKGFNYGVTVSFNLFNGFDLWRQEQNTNLEIQNSKLQQRDVRNQVRGNLAQTYKNYENSLRLIALEQENLQVADQNVDISLEQFRLGSITPLELREAQRNYITAQNRLIAAQYAAKQAETELLRASGQLVQ